MRVKKPLPILVLKIEAEKREDMNYMYSKNRMDKFIANMPSCLRSLAIFLTTLPLQAQETKGHQPGGIIKGAVNTPWVKRYPALVYVDQVKG